MATPRTAGRPTISNVARRAGVSISTASYALNNQYGASAATRERVLAAAAELGWSADSSARRLASARSETIGLALARQTAETFGEAPWFMEFIGGIEAVLARNGYGLLLQAVRDTDHELAVYRTWSASRRVDGVVLVDVTIDDPRLPVVSGLRLPAIVAGPPDYAGGLGCVWTDDATAVRRAVDHLAELGHRRLVHLAGPSRLAHSVLRQQAFRAASADRGLQVDTFVTDFSADQARAAIRSVLLSAERPTAVLFDDDLSAAAALGVAYELGVVVPDELSLLAWDDSILCRSTYPALSAMSHDVAGYGSQVADRLLDRIGGAEPTVTLDEPAHLVRRGSTAPPPD